jgi:DNA-binding transcriptional ArsR family regulator
MKKQVTIQLDEKSFSKYFKAFGDKSRLKILNLLTAKELTVNEIVAKVGLSQPTVSRHLGILREAGVVSDRREGQKVYYGLKKLAILNCCEGFCDCLMIQVEPDKSKKSGKKEKKAKK